MKIYPISTDRKKTYYYFVFDSIPDMRFCINGITINVNITHTNNFFFYGRQEISLNECTKTFQKMASDPFFEIDCLKLASK